MQSASQGPCKTLVFVPLVFSPRLPSPPPPPPPPVSSVLSLSAEEIRQGPVPGIKPYLSSWALRPAGFGCTDAAVQLKHASF